jgi:ribosome modulation factor
MSEFISPMRKQAVYAEGKTAWLDGKRRGNNPYRWHNKELASIWVNGWDQAKKDNQIRDHRLL